MGIMTYLNGSKQDLKLREQIQRSNISIKSKQWTKCGNKTIPLRDWVKL